MKTSAAGRALITAREGYRLHAYRDSEGIWTIGVGHTGRMTPPRVTPGMTITGAQCDLFLEMDLQPVERVLNAVLAVTVTQNQFDALASLIFNVGIGYADRSMTLIARLNAGDIEGAAAGFDRFHKPAAIIKRRNAEKAQFLTPDAPALARRPAPSSASPIVAQAIHESAQATSGPSPAPSATAADSTKGKPMSSIISEAEKAGVDAIAGLTNFFGNIGAQLQAGASVASAGVTTTASGDAIPPAATGATGGNVEGAITEIETLVADARAGKWANEIKDVFDLLTTGMAILAKFGVSIPGLSQLVGLLPAIEAIV